MIAAADQPATTSVLDTRIEILQWQSDFLKYINANVEMSKAKNTKVKVFGLETTEVELLLIIMANMGSRPSTIMVAFFTSPSKTSAANSSTIAKTIALHSSRC